MADQQSRFAPADEVLAMLESIPGINDTLNQRKAARELMEHRHRVEQDGPAAKSKEL